MMLLRMSELFEILFMFLGLNYICSKRYRAGIYDTVFFVIVLVILDLVNAGYIDKICMTLGYILLGVYVLVKFRPTVRQFFVDITLFFVYMVGMELMLSVPAYFMTETLWVEVLILSANASACLVTVFIGRKQVLWRIASFITSNDWLVRGIIFCCSLGAVYLVVVMKFSYILRSTDYIIFGLWTALICILTVMWQKSRNEVVIRKKEMELQKTYEGVYRDLLQSIRRRQHEFDNHLIALCGIYKTVDSIEALIREQKLYCEEINRDNRYNKLMSVESPILVGFLYSKFTLAEERDCGITYRVEIMPKEKRLIPEYGMVEILGILIDNAMEALDGRAPRRIDTEITEGTDRMQILVRNNSAYIPQEEIRHFVRAGYSTKGKDRGFGLASVAALVDRYDGELRIYNEEHDGMNWLVVKISRVLGRFGDGGVMEPYAVVCRHMFCGSPVQISRRLILGRIWQLAKKNVAYVSPIQKTGKGDTKIADFRDTCLTQTFHGISSSPVDLQREAAVIVILLSRILPAGMDSEG